MNSTSMYLYYLRKLTREHKVNDLKKNEEETIM